MFLTTSEILFVKPEGTFGVSSDPLDKTNSYTTPAIIDFRARGIEVTADGERDDESSKYANGGYSGDESIIGKTTGTAKFSVKATAGEFILATKSHKFPETKLLNSCGAEMITVKDSPALNLIGYPVSYMFYPTIKRASSSVTIASVKSDETLAGVATEITGATGNFTFSADGTAKPFMMEFSYGGSVQPDDKGIWDISVANNAKLKVDPANITKNVAEKFVRATITLVNLKTLVSTSICSTKYSFDAGCVSTPVECQIGASGVYGNMISGQSPKLTITPQMMKMSQLEFWKAMNNGEKYSIDLVVDTSVADVPPIRMFIPCAELISAPSSDQNGFQYREASFRPLNNASKTLPVVKYFNNTTGTATTFLYTGTSIIGQEFDATWFLIFGERKVD